MPPNARLAAFSHLWVHWQALTLAFRRDGIAAFTHLQQTRDAASAKLFQVFSSGFISYEDTTIIPSLVNSASGVVLDLGPGPGNQMHRFNIPAIERIYGVEPNPHFAANINAKIDMHGLQDKYQLIIAGIEDSDVLRKAGIKEGSLDTVLCIQVLCAVKGPKVVMKEVWKLLKPGGKFIFWEHGRSRNRLTRVAQAVTNPAWSTFVGCQLTRNVLADILEAGEWEHPEDVEEPEDPLSCLPRIQGVLVKKA